MIKSLLAKKQKAQALVIVALAFMGLLAFVGLAIDGTELFLNYTRLKRAVDSAAVAAANDFKQNTTIAQMTQAAVEVLDMQQVRQAVNVTVYTCDTTGLQTLVPDFYTKCPTAAQIASGTPKRKLVYVKADEASPTYFLGLFGIYSVPITTNSVSEAASVDLVVVIDTSLSMGRDTPGYGTGYNPNSATGCNTLNLCEPLNGAKNAAASLINTLYSGYDQVSIVTFDTVAVLRYALGTPSGALTTLSTSVPLHYDAPASKLFPGWYVGGNAINLINPEDRDGDGVDNDAGLASTQCTPDATGRWDSTKNIPCDAPNLLDTFDWNGDGIFKTYADASGNCPNPNNPAADDDYCNSKLYQKQNTPPIPVLDGPAIDPNSNPLPMSLLSTCTGCGIRLATSVLTSSGRTNSVWVMVFLTDGVANMSDTHQTAPYNLADAPMGVATQYPNGYCNGQIVVNGTPGPKYSGYRNDWSSSANCRELLTPTVHAGENPTYTRYCINDHPDECPPNSVALLAGGSGYSFPYSPPYGVLDYAMDMTDAAALRKSTNPNEKLGNTIAIYTIGFGNDAAAGAPLLRYMAAVGDDGDRTTDPCLTHTDPRESCGQYYFAPDTSALDRVFRDIASRIYTKITE